MSNTSSQGNTQIKIGPGRSQSVEKGGRVQVQTGYVTYGGKTGIISSANQHEGAVELDGSSTPVSIPLIYLHKPTGNQSKPPIPPAPPVLRKPNTTIDRF